MSINILFIIDPIIDLKLYKDTSFAFMLEAKSRGFNIYYCLPSQLFYKNNNTYGLAQRISVTTKPNESIQIESEQQILALTFFEIIMMRKDPPFDMNYIYTTYLLEHAVRQGVNVINNPASLRNNNEKVFITQFPDCMPATTITSQTEVIKSFIVQHKKVVLKPLDGMGGKDIFLSHLSDPNLDVIIQTLTNNYTTPIIIQEFIPEIAQGDKRILMLHGKPFPYALTRTPKQNSIRGNLAAGGSAKGVTLTEKDQLICQTVGPKLLEQGILFAGLDVIGEYLTEINITSPTCVREIDTIYNTNIAADFFDGLAI